MLEAGAVSVLRLLPLAPLLLLELVVESVARGASRLLLLALARDELAWPSS